MIRCLSLLVAVAVATLASSAEAQQWGSLKGQFVYDGAVPTPTKLEPNKDVEVCGKCALFGESLTVDPTSKGIANIVIYCRTRGVKVNPEVTAALPETVELDNDCCRFEPHVAVLTLDQTLTILNSDAVGHNAACAPLGDTPFNPIIPPNGKVTHKFGRAQRVPQPVSCSIHPWMKGWVLPLDHPYFAVTDAEGKFEIKGLPAGEELEFQVWQEKAGYLEAKSDWKRGQFEATIPADGLDLGTIKVAASEFEE